MDGKASGGAYGAGMAGGAFNVLAFIKKPQVILRIVSWFFAVIVFGCISSQGWEEDNCKYNKDKNACGFGTAIGVLAFLGLTAFLIFDALFENFISSVQHRKYIVMADMVFSGVWSFFWFVCFCYLADAWRRSEGGEFGVSGVQAAIAFSFFSIASFAGITFFAFQRYRQGISETFASQYDQSQQGGGGGGDTAASPYSGYPAPVGDTGPDPYQQPSFNQEQKQPATGDFQAPAY